MTTLPQDCCSSECVCDSVKGDGTAGKNNQAHSYTQRFQHPSFNNWKNLQTNQ